MSFTKPNTESVAYKRLWRNLNEEQRECLVKHNRIPVYTKKGNLLVIPYSRFHDHRLQSRGDPFDHVSVQLFKKDENGVHRFCRLYCGGADETEAAANVLGIKLLLESKETELYAQAAHLLGQLWSGRFKEGMTLEETYEIEVDSIPFLGEKP